MIDHSSDPQFQARAPSQASPGDVLGRLRRALGERYLLDRELGRGGMGRVFLARDLRHQRPVAVKILHPELATAVGNQRFLQEIETAARLTHPHILSIHDSGVAEGLLYYIMPYVEGESLRERLRGDEQLPVQDAIHFARQIADALAFAHANGIVHRDLKPENILFPTPTHAVLADFGLARAVYTASNHRITPTGMALGSPLYMSPEQARGLSGVDGRADVYSIGCVLFEMLTKVPPFHGPTAQAVIQRKLSEPIPAVRALRPEVPRRLEAVVQRAMRRLPEERFQSMEEFARALGRAAESPQRRWGRVGVGAGMLLVLFLAVYLLLRPPGSLVSAGALEPPVPMVLARFESPSGDTTLLDPVTELTRTGLAESPLVSLVDQGRLAEALQRMRLPESTSISPAVAREIALREGLQAVVTGSITRLGGGYSLSLQLVAPDSAEVLASVDALARDTTELFGAVGQLTRAMRERIGETATALRAAAPLEEVTTSSLPALRKYSRALRALNEESDYARGVALLEEAIALDPQFAMAHRALGVALANQGGHWARALKSMRRAFELRDRLPELERGLATGVYYTAIDEEEKAIVAYRTLLDTYPANTSALNNLAFLYSGLGDYRSAERYFADALAVDTSALFLTNLYDAQFNQGKIAEARATYRRFVTRYPEHPERLSAAAYLAAALGDYATAERHARSLLKAHQTDTAWRINALFALRALAAVQGRLGEAEEYAREETRIQVERGTPAGYLRGAVALGLLDVHARRDPQRALRRVEEALQAYPLGGLDFDDRPYVRIARFYADAGRPDRVRAILAQHQASADPAQPRLMREEQHSIRAALALAEGRGAAAVEHLQALGPSRCLICTLPYLGRAHEAAGRPDSAIAVYERYVNTPYMERLDVDYVWLPFVYRRLADLHQRRGDPERAALYTRRRNQLWARADPELRNARAR